MEQSIDLNRLRLFLQIVEAGNLTRAARIHGLPKSKLSRDLSLLEEELGAPLIYRTTRQFELTAAGRELFDNVADHLAQVGEAVSRASGSSLDMSGVIRLTAPDDIGYHLITPILDDFKKLHPKVDYDIIYSNQVLDLVREKIDVAIRVGRLKDSSLRQRKVGDIEKVMVISKKRQQEIQGELTWEKLEQMPGVMFGASQKKPFWSLVSSGQKKKVFLSPVIKTDNYMVVRDFVLRGHGVGFIPKFIVRESLLKGELVQLFPRWRNPEEAIQIVYPQQKEVPARIKGFVQYLVRHLSSSLN